MPRRKDSSYDIGGKLCSKCREWKAVEKFNKRKTSMDSFENWCKECNRALSHKHNNSVEGKAKQYRRYIEKYGITVEQYDEMVVEQNGVCAICFHPEEHFTRLVIDHCHETGKVRGLLCNNCNRGLGLLKDRSETLLSAVRYLRGTS